MAEHANIIPRKSLSPRAMRWRRFASWVWPHRRRQYLMAASVAIREGYEPDDVSMVGQTIIEPLTVQIIMRDGGVCLSSGDYLAPPEGYPA